MPQSHADLVKLLKAKPDVYKEKIATFDPEKSGVGFLMMTQDAKVFPQFWDLAKGFGATGAKVAQLENTRAIGQVLYTQYFYLFQVAGAVLLVAMIGAIVLTLRSRPGVRRQKVGEQLYRTKADAISVVKVQSRGGV